MFGPNPIGPGSSQKRVRAQRDTCAQREAGVEVQGGAGGT